VLGQFLSGGAAPGVLLPNVTELRLLLEAKGVRGLELLLEPRSFRQVPRKVIGEACVAVLCGVVPLYWPLFKAKGMSCSRRQGPSNICPGR
jgi:hypothetical protein